MRTREEVCNEAVKVIVGVEVEQQGSSPCADKVAYALADAGLLRVGETEAEVEELRAALVEVAPAEVEVEGSFFRWLDLPVVLGNHMRSLVESQREAKRYAVEVQGLRAELEQWAEAFPCDGGCAEGDLEVTCSRHGHRPAGLWRSMADNASILARLLGERDDAHELRTRIAAMADEFSTRVDWSAGRSDYGDNAAWEQAARLLRGVLDGGA